MITILCSGSRGDFQPYIALAQELQKHGKAVRIVGGKSSEDFIKGYGIADCRYRTQKKIRILDIII